MKPATFKGEAPSHPSMPAIVDLKEVTHAVFHDSYRVIPISLPVAAASGCRHSGRWRQEFAGGARVTAASTTGAVAALPISGFHMHGGHRRGSVQASAGTDALTSADSTSDTSTPATSQSIFSSLLQTAEQVAGVQLTAPTTSTSAASSASAAAVQSSTGGRIRLTA